MPWGLVTTFYIRCACVEWRHDTSTRYEMVDGPTSRSFFCARYAQPFYVCSRSHAQVILRPCGSHGLNKPATTLRLFLSPLLVITFRKKINKNHWRHLMWYKTYKWLRSGSRPRSRGMGPLSELLFICLCMPTTCQLWRNHATEKKKRKKEKKKKKKT